MAPSIKVNQIVCVTVLFFVGVLSEPFTYVRRNASLISIPGDIPNNFQKIDLSINLLSTIPSQAFSGYPQLRELNVSHNVLSTIAEDAFKNTQISVLWISDNNLTELPSVSWIKDTLTHLYAHHNRITSIGSEFKDIARLQGLYLNDNNLAAEKFQAWMMF